LQKTTTPISIIYI